MSARIAPAWLTAPETRRVIAALEAARPGAARFVGGCVRDALLGVEAADIDIATQLSPESVIAAAAQAGLAAHPTGIEHGTVTLVADHRPFEVTTLRRDVETDGRRAVVAFTERWEEDAARRDFHMNALYAAPDGTVFDPTGHGLGDLAARRIAFIGDAETRIREDYLRVLRFFRFSAWYARDLDPAGLAACAALREGVRTLSAERVWKELKKLLAAPRPLPALRAMQETGVLAIVAPEIERLDGLVSVASGDPLVRFAALLPDGPALARALAKRLRLSTEERDRLSAALDPELDLPAEPEPGRVRALVYAHGRAAVLDRAAARGRSSASLSDLADWRPPRLPVDGADAKALGATPGPKLGAALKAVEAWWIAADFPDDRAAALAKLAEVIRAES